MLVYPNAKINLGLNIVEKRPDGYHNIETLFYPIGLSDVLEVVFPESSEPYVWQSSGIDVDCPAENNLCIKALMSLRKAAERKGIELPCVGLHLHKVVPTGAGLGGGSSDAAFVAKTVNDMLSLGFTVKELEEIVSPVGADCPFFIADKPQFATGIGDVLTPAKMTDLSGKWLMLIKPSVAVPTKVAYSKVKPRRPQICITEIVSQPVEEWRGKLENDFEESVFAEFPIVGEIKDALYASGAVYASMSGSGSSIFGIFDKEPSELQNLSSDFFVWKGRM
ncbi:MAG: 4-(cytidine 5'-diphospho)-2-C-methyl-D-erythritol kinase [Bacteroidales bacterium]|nr:4-(cytidine 5'-diphospho)-2-C-methyl-D-erythritol kinase [Bacteroidales bacterium]